MFSSILHVITVLVEESNVSKGHAMSNGKLFFQKCGSMDFEYVHFKARGMYLYVTVRRGCIYSSAHAFRMET
jgi:hypothetical protein